MTIQNDIQEYLNQGKLKEAAAYIKQTLRNGADLENLDILLAHILLLSGDWTEIDSLLTHNTNFLSASGWLNSIATQRPVNSDSKPIPWYTYSAIDFLDGIVKKHWTVFEWGCGNSTHWWSYKAGKVISIEDNEAWYREVKAHLPDNAELYYKTENDYSDCILAFPDKHFDAIIIDGSFRNESAGNSVSKIKDSGMIIFDNSDNAMFDQSQKHLADAGFYRIDFWRLIPSYLYKNCTSIYFKDPIILRNDLVPSAHKSSIGMSCQQSLNYLTGESKKASVNS